MTTKKIYTAALRVNQNISCKNSDKSDPHKYNPYILPSQNLHFIRTLNFFIEFRYPTFLLCFFYKTVGYEVK